MNFEHFTNEIALYLILSCHPFSTIVITLTLDLIFLPLFQCVYGKTKKDLLTGRTH